MQIKRQKLSCGSWDLQLPVHITTKVVSSNPARGKVFWLQLYVIKVYQRLVAVAFSGNACFSSTNITDSHNMNEILLKVALSTITLTLYSTHIYIYKGVDVVEGAGRKAKRMVLQCINGVGSNPVEGRTKI